MNFILFIYLELNPPHLHHCRVHGNRWFRLSIQKTPGSRIETSPDHEHVSDVKSWDVVMSDVRKSLKKGDIGTRDAPIFTSVCWVA